MSPSASFSWRSSLSTRSAIAWSAPAISRLTFHPLQPVNRHARVGEEHSFDACTPPYPGGVTSTAPTAAVAVVPAPGSLPVPAGMATNGETKRLRRHSVPPPQPSRGDDQRDGRAAGGALRPCAQRTDVAAPRARRARACCDHDGPRAGCHVGADRRRARHQPTGRSTAFRQAPAATAVASPRRPFSGRRQGFTLVAHQRAATRAND